MAPVNAARSVVEDGEVLERWVYRVLVDVVADLAGKLEYAGDSAVVFCCHNGAGLQVVVAQCGSRRCGGIVRVLERFATEERHVVGVWSC